jgi:hypothetical protein
MVNLKYTLVDPPSLPAFLPLMQVDNMTKSVVVTLQGVMPATHWMAFGFSDPRQPRARMIGSDVVVVGQWEGQPFAIDYYLSDKDQCNYAGAQVSCCSCCWLRKTSSLGHHARKCNKNPGL